MSPKYNGGSVARGHPGGRGAKGLRVKAHKADHEFSGVEYVRNGPPLLWPR